MNRKKDSQFQNTDHPQQDLLGNPTEPDTEPDTRQDNQPDKKPEEMIEDLESIKNLLDEDEPYPAEDDPDIPLLDDPLDATVKEDEGLSEETIQSLLNDTWKDSIEAVLDDARETIEDNSTAWLPADTDELNAALKIRIDTSVRQWLGEVLQANIGALRELIVKELTTELLAHLHKKLNSSDPTATHHDKESHAPDGQ